MISVNLALVSSHVIPSEFLDYLLPLIFHTLQKGIKLTFSISHASFVDWARNICVEEALNDYNSDYVFFLDVDVFPPQNIIEKLLAQNKDIVSGPYHSKKPPFHPHAYKELDNGSYETIEIKKNSLLEVDAVGAGCLLIKTNVLKKMTKPWFSTVLPGLNAEHAKDLKFDKTQGLGEDLYFCKKARNAGFKIYYDNTINNVFHIGAKVGYDLYLKYLKEEN